MKKLIAAMILLLSIGVFGYAGWQYYKIQTDYQAGIDEYNEVRDQFRQTQEPSTVPPTQQTEAVHTISAQELETASLEELQAEAVKHERSGKLTMFRVPIDYLIVKPYSFDFDRLVAINDQVRAWIIIEDTNIDYPVVQGIDNEFYLRHTVELENNNAGSIFLEATLYSPFEQKNTIIYGHNQKNHQMFHDLTYYTSYEYWEAHPYIRIVTPTKEYLYEIFSCYETDSSSRTFSVSYVSDRDYADYLRWCAEQSVFEIPVEPVWTDRVLTLSTCTNVEEEGRYIVQAKLIRENLAE